MGPHEVTISFSTVMSYLWMVAFGLGMWWIKRTADKSDDFEAWVRGEIQKVEIENAKRATAEQIGDKIADAVKGLRGN